MNEIMPRKLILILAIGLVSVPVIFCGAQGQQRDSLIVGTVSIDTSHSIVWVPVYGVTFDSLDYYNIQVVIQGQTDGILMGNIINYYPPVDSWLHEDYIYINRYRISQEGWADTGPLLFTDGVRVHLWSITFMILHGSPIQTLVINAVDSVSFGYNTVFIPGYVVYGPLAVNEKPLPEEFVLSQNYPNPFNSSTTIKFYLQDEGDISIIIYNLLGQRVKGIINGTVSAGEHSAVWNGTDDVGVDVPSGAYFCRLQSGTNTEIIRMTLLR
jgi:hypothetical protein